MKQICLLNAPIGNGHYNEWDLSSVDTSCPPLGLLYLAGAIKKRGYPVSLIDAENLKLGPLEIVNKILDSSTEIVGISATTPVIHSAAEIAACIKRTKGDILTIIGGPHVTAAPIETMNTFPVFDVGVIGEGEETILELLDTIAQDRDFSNVKGLIVKDRNGLKINEPREFITDIDSLALPAWDLLPSLTKDYHYSIIETHGRPSAAIVTSRGCPQKCSFCDRKVFGNIYREHSAEYVLEMIRLLKFKYGVKDLMIFDDNFMLSKARLMKICNCLIKEKFDLSWFCVSNLKNFELDKLKAMKEAGCWLIEVGIESGSQEILNAMKREITLERIELAIKMANSVGIKIKGNFIFGNINETEDTLKMSINFAKKLDLFLFQQTFLTPFPGSGIYEIAREYGKFDSDWGKMNNFYINFVPNGLTKNRLLAYSKKAYTSFYLRPGIIFRHIQDISSFARIKNLFLSFITLLKVIFRNKRAI